MFVTVFWLVQSFLWGGVYLGCGLTVAVSMVALARLVVKDYVSHGSFVYRWVVVVVLTLTHRHILARGHT